MEPFIAEVILFGGNFAPRGWAYCDGQLLAIAQYSALFSLLGTTYGGDGRTSFGLPDLRGRVAIGPRSGPGLSDYRLGQRGGVEQVTLNVTQMPSHNHTGGVGVTEEDADSEEPKGNVLGLSDVGNIYARSGAQAGKTLSGLSINNTGGNLPHENRQPFFAINYIIALQGVFPSRN